MVTLSEKREECGVAAIFSKTGKSVTHLLYNALIALQHRGQDAAGMALYDQTTKKLTVTLGIGLVGGIFSEENINTNADIGIGHTRYPTTGRCLIEDVQPSVIDDIAVAHNGHLINYKEVREVLENDGYNFMSTVDSEPIAYLLHKKIIKERETIEEAVRYLMKTLDGAYSTVALVNGTLVIFRDPHAIRPLVYGENKEYISFVSESAALDINNIEYKGVVNGGDVVIINSNLVKKEVIKNEETRHCMFEYVYFSRPDSCINNKYVFEVREVLGKELAKEHPVNADLIIAVPDTSRTAADAYSDITKIPMREGLIKNRYIGRTFIMSSQEVRSSAVRTKLNAVRKIIEGKRIVVIDDSIVRSTTMREIVKLIRDAGAKEIHLRITCPPIKAPCFYGVDIPTYEQLIAHDKTIEEIRKHIGVESLGYLSIEGLKRSIGQPICTGCLDENYPTKGARYAAGRASKKEVRGEGCGCC